MAETNSRPPSAPEAWRDSAMFQRWTEAGLIDAGLATRLHAFESAYTQKQAQRRPALAVALLGALGVVTGIGVLIAHNWERLGDNFKLAGMFALLGLASGWAYTESRKPSVRGDIPLLLSFGFTLAGLGLVSQIYHQDGDLWTLLAVWCGLTAPLMLSTVTRFAQILWYLSLWGSLWSSYESWDELANASRAFRGQGSIVTLFVLGVLGALVAAPFSRARLEARSETGVTFLGLHLGALGALGSVASFVDEPGLPAFALLGLGAFALLALALHGQGTRLGLGSDNEARLLLGVGLLGMVVPLVIGNLNNGFLAFLAFAAFWGLTWFFAERAASPRLVRLAIGLLAFRVLLASFELFESMLVSGLVLVGLGIALLVVTRAGLGTRNKEAAS